MNEDLKKDIVNILEYFRAGLSDIKAGSGEDQPMLQEIESVLGRISSYRKKCDCNYRNTSYQAANGDYMCGNCHLLIPNYYKTDIINEPEFDPIDPNPRDKIIIMHGAGKTITYSPETHKWH